MKKTFLLLITSLAVLALSGFLSAEKESKEKSEASIVYLTKEAELNKVLKANSMVLLDFYADWCGPCKKLAPELVKLSAENKKLKIVKVNVDNAKELTAAYDISSIPALFYFKDGKKVKSSVGFKSKDQLKTFMSSNAKASSSCKACCP